MKAFAPRDLGAHAVIVLAVAAGASFALLGPIEDRLGAARTELNVASGLMLKSGELSAEASQWKLRAQRDAAARARLEQLSAIAQDSAQIQDRLMNLAAQRAVRIDRIQPRAASGASLPSTGDPATEPVRPAAVVGNIIEAGGSYDALTAFLGDVQNLGLTRITSVRFTPVVDGDERSVRATIQTTHYAFSIPNPPVETAALGATP